MSLAEEMLATMSASDDSSTYLSEEEPHIIIDNSRTAFVPSSLKTIAVTGDHEVEKITFDCVRFWDGNDLSTFAIYLNYVLPDLSTGTYIPSSIVADDNVFHFDWDIKNNITQQSGKIAFAITAIKTKKNDSGETVVDKQWSSIPNGDCSIALGIDISNVPAEEESSYVVAQLSAILEQIHADVDEWIKTVVVQTTGTSKKQVMSQKAVTTSLNMYKAESILQSIQYTDSKYNLLDKKISRDSKRITNLEQGLPSEQFMTDSTVAYTKDVPSNALPYASINKIGGMTYKSKNLFIPSKVNTTNLGITFSYFNGYVKMSGTKTSGLNIITVQTPNITLPAGTYTVSCKMVSGSITLANNFDGVYFGINKSTYSLRTGDGVSVIGAVGKRVITLTEPTEISSFDITPGYAGDGTVFNDALFAFQFEDGDTATTYQGGYEGLRSAMVTAVKSVGANLFSGTEITEKTSGGVTYTWNETEQTITLVGATSKIFEIFIPLKNPIGLAGGTYTMKCEIMKNESAAPLRFGVCDMSNPYGVENGYSNLASIDSTKKVYTFAQDANVNYIHIYCSSVGTLDAKFKVMLNEGSTAEPYAPYVEHTLPIPEEVRPANGINENVYDFIEWAEDGSVKSHKMVEKVVFDGSADEAWDFKSGRDYACAPVTALGTARFPIFANKQGIDAIWLNLGYPKHIQYGHSGTPLPHFASIEEFRAWLSQNPLEIVYELATPIVTDISDLISTADNLIGVEGGGTLTFENEYGYAVPSEVEYQVEV